MASEFRNIGKEADHWEEQFYLGLDENADIDRGLSPDGVAQVLLELREAAESLGQRELAKQLRISFNTLSKWLAEKSEPKRRHVTIIRRLLYV